MYDVHESVVDTLSKMDSESKRVRVQCLGSLINFTKLFYKLRTGREYRISLPLSREPHALQICRDLTKVFYGEISNEIIQIPPRYGKTELAIHYAAWCLAHHPDCNFLYLSYSHSLASKQTEVIRDIIGLPYYRKLFGVELSGSSAAKDHFQTTVGGTVYASGFGGTITGFGAGIRGITDRFGGCIIIDDAHKPDEVASDTIRESVIENYTNTIPSRRNNGVKTPIVAIAQSLHEDDLMERLKKDNKFNQLILPALDQFNNPLDPDLHSYKDLMEMKDKSPYFFAAQMQQCPQPAGGGLFKEDNFLLLDNEPSILATYITADTAETDKTYNDATVFSFWGIYKVVQSYTETDIYALHWINCVELWIEPKDLQNEFLQFYASCLRYKIKPVFSAIERKSTGTTLVSILKTMQGLKIIDIERNRSSGSKTTRFIEAQQYIASRLISLPRGAAHTKMCIEHMRKITANNTHARDDIADTAVDAINIGLRDKLVLSISSISSEQEDAKVKSLIKIQKNNFTEKTKLWE